MTISARQLNRATLHRQLLLERRHVTVADAVRQILAIQAQEPASPYLALWNRIAGFDPADLDTAFADGTVVKATLMRVTLHAVHADDHPVLYQAMLGAMRSYRMDGPRFRDSGLDAAVTSRRSCRRCCDSCARRGRMPRWTRGSRSDSAGPPRPDRGGRCGCSHR